MYANLVTAETKDLIGRSIRLMEEYGPSVYLGQVDYAFEEDGVQYVIMDFTCEQETFKVDHLLHDSVYVSLLKPV
jgi:hypothetical protein